MSAENNALDLGHYCGRAQHQSRSRPLLLCALSRVRVVDADREQREVVHL